MVLRFPFFSDFGIYNVTAEASNPVTVETDGHTILPMVSELVVLVTSAPCSPPTVSIPINATENRKTLYSDGPLKYPRSEPIITASLAKLNCSGVLSTR